MRVFNKMTILFEAKTQAAHAFKILIDTLNHYLNKNKGGSFKINSKGIFLVNTNLREDVLCKVSLLAENFQTFILNVNGDLCFSINLNTFYNEMLKKIRKKDIITLQITNENSKMYLKVSKESSENSGNVSSAKTVIINSSSISIDPPTGYNLPIIVPSKLYHQSCREITRPNNKFIEITCWNDKTLRFFTSKDGVVENEAIFGCSPEIKQETFKAQFFASHAVRPVKLANLGEIVKISVKKDLPLFYKINIGCLGEIEIYIKSVDQIESEEEENEENY